MSGDLDYAWFDRYQRTMGRLPRMNEEKLRALAGKLEAECAEITGDDDQANYDRGVCRKLLEHVEGTIWIIRNNPPSRDEGGAQAIVRSRTD